MKHTLKRNIAMALVLALGITVLSGCSLRKKTVTGELEGSPYPCTWEVKGSVCTLSIRGELPANVQWALYENADAIDAEPQRATGQFKVTALEAGSGAVTVTLRESGLPVEKGVDFNFCFSVDEEKNITVDSATYTRLGADAFTTESGKTACWQESTVGGQFLYLTGTDWTVVSTQGVAVYGPTVDGENVRLEVMAGEETAERNLVLQSSDGEGIVFTFIYSNNVLTVGETAAKTAEEVEALLQSLNAAEETEEEEIYYGPATEKAKELMKKYDEDGDEEAFKAEYTEELDAAVRQEAMEYANKQQRQSIEANNASQQG